MTSFPGLDVNVYTQIILFILTGLLVLELIVHDPNNA